MINLVNIFSLFLLFAGFVAFPLSLVPPNALISGSPYDLVNVMFLAAGIGCFSFLGSGPFLRLMKRPLGQRSKVVVRAIGEGFVVWFCGCASGLTAGAGNLPVLSLLSFGGCVLGVCRFLYLVVREVVAHRNSLRFLAQQFQNYQPITTTSADSGLPVANATGDFVVYHGTPDAAQVRKIIREGLMPGNGKNCGTGVYMAESFDEAKEYAKKGGRVLELHIKGNTPYKIYEDLSGNTAEDKWFFASGGLFQILVWVKSGRWFVCYGSNGKPVQIPGLRKVTVKDYWGNYVNA